MGRPVDASQSRAVISSPPVITVLSSGLKATPLTALDAQGLTIGRPVDASRAAPYRQSSR